MIRGESEKQLKNTQNAIMPTIRSKDCGLLESWEYRKLRRLIRNLFRHYSNHLAMNVSQLLRPTAVTLACIGFALLWGCGAGNQAHDQGDAHSSKEYYELREYQISSEDQQSQVLAYLKDAAVPGLNRQGISPVGVFTLTDDTTDAADGLNVYMLIPYQSLDQFVEAPDKLMADEAHNSAGAAYLNVSDRENPAFDRIHSTLMVAFDSMPKMEVPSLTAGNQDRIFELRSYESFSEKKGQKKIDMFNIGGEVPIFKNIGAQPVFFAKAITGIEQPNLVYMTTFKDMEDNKAKWDAFRTDPGWVAIKDLEEYKNTVSKIYKYYLSPTDFSQL